MEDGGTTADLKEFCYREVTQKIRPTFSES